MKKIQLSLFPFAGSMVAMLLIFVAMNSFGQTTQPTDAQKAERERAKNEQQASAKGGSDDVKTYEERMQKMDEMYRKLEQKSQSTNDPQMKKDIASMQAQMNKMKTDMEAYKNGHSTMSDEQKERTRASLKSQEDELRNTYNHMKTKYGKGKEAKPSKTATREQTKAHREAEPAAPAK